MAKNLDDRLIALSISERMTCDTQFPMPRLRRAWALPDRCRGTTPVPKVLRGVA
jgi:hypothetical protein